ncbi:PREDICTED: adenylyl cyclase-associated protein 1 isoform X2 [Wasmannia auropunctata]|uniref:adenylyl cyclase-associated protein 1 isoform X2 n=1 Tax=Wasmannia auropunctata TaxID=64793 RepID=UPI0005EDE52A|nr:PREDICTED: adenylyl cyclase-associated protein 1 isoform X2 [Wasmannia auropunctata]
MFKCCVCQTSKRASTERSDADDTPVGSPKLTAGSFEVDDEIESTVKVDQLNGNLQKSGETSPVEDKDASLEDKDALPEDKDASSQKNKYASPERKIASPAEDKDASLEDKDALPEDKDASPQKNASLEDEDASPEKHVSLETKDASSEDKDASPEEKDASLEEKGASLEDKDASLEDKDASIKEKDVLLEDKDVSLEDKDVWLEDKDVSSENKDVSLQDNIASLQDKIASLEDTNVWLEDEDATLEDKNAWLENEDALIEMLGKDALPKDRDAPLVFTPPVIRASFMMRSSCVVSQNGSTDIEESSSSTSTKETVEEAGEETGDRIVDDKDNINILDGVAAEDWTEDVDSTGAVGPVKMNLYDASGYIERTIDDGPEEEGDDSVFEGYPSENEIKKAPPGCESNEKEEHLEELVNRLENVTKRLENVHFVVKTQDTAVQTSTPSPNRSTSGSSLSPRLSPLSRQEIIPSPPANMSVAGYEDFLAGPVKEYLKLSQKIGGDVAVHSKLVEKAFQIQLQFVQMAASRAAPANQSEQVSLFAPMSQQIQQIQEFREKNRGSPFFNHLSAISESIPALGWVAVSPTPAPYVKEMNDAGQFYTNRVLKDWKEKNKIHIDWCKAWVQTLTDLQQYVRQHHTTGLVWGKTAAPAGACGIPPPPPPSMPIGDIAPLLNDDRSALFAQINQGEDITKSLKKVTSDMQTHKNPGLRSGPAPFKAPTVNAALMKTVLPANAPIDKPPVFTRDGKKWLVEYHKGENLVIDNVEMNNVIYMFRCQDSTLTVKGKVNSVVMDSCRKSSVVFDSVVASVEFVNCQSVQMQVLGKVPTISIDKTDGCQMYLSTDSLGVELITSKSSEMNVMVPKPNGDYSEYPVPEQFKTTISQNGLSTMAVDSLG